MNIRSIRIQNLRSFRDETIDISDYTSLVGANGSGKSNVLCALNIFFHEKEGVSTDLGNLGIEDFHLKDTREPIVITLTFGQLVEEERKDFASYVRDDKLVLLAKAVFDPNTALAVVKQYAPRMMMESFIPFWQATDAGAKVADLKVTYDTIRAKLVELPAAGPKESMVSALREYEQSHLASCRPTDCEDKFYGVAKGANLLEKYIQWVFVPAVKDSVSEQTETKGTALSRILARTVRAKLNFTDDMKRLRDQTREQYQSILQQKQAALVEISTSLQKRLSEWSHPDAKLKIEWRLDPDKSVKVDDPFAQVVVGEGGFEGELSRFGNGFQRSYLLALLQELAASEGGTGPRLILACEEPELFQHPPQARHLYGVLQELCGGNAQVIVTTHSPYFVSGDRFEDVRLVRKEASHSKISNVTFEQISQKITTVTGALFIRPAGRLAKIHQSLLYQIGEMFFASHLVLVEGKEDLAYITSYLNLMDLWGDFRGTGCHIVPTDGKSNMIQPLAIALGLGIPVYIVFDSDGEKPDKNGSRVKHRADNEALLKLKGVTNPESFPNQTFWSNGIAMWNSEIQRVVADEIGTQDWQEYSTKADCRYDNAGDLQKNALHIGTCLMAAWNDGKKSASLEKLCRSLIEFGRI
ncbi:MAG: AAA family ATPase [Dehalococcoidales bacterium]|nr:AAA family ATPase [Dehalococcoidales bacterium]